MEGSILLFRFLLILLIFHGVKGQSFGTLTVTGLTKLPLPSRSLSSTEGLNLSSNITAITTTPTSNTMFLKITMPTSVKIKQKIKNRPEFPFMVSINTKISKKSTVPHVLCSGILEDPLQVLTTASCVANIHENNLEVKFGKSKYDNNSITREVVDITQHPLYNAGNFSMSIYNLAWLTLESSVDNETAFSTASLDSSNNSLELSKITSGNQSCIVAGFNTFGELYLTDIKMIPLNNCSSELKEEIKDSTHFCGMNVNRSQCLSDEGAVLICNRRVAGMLTYKYESNKCQNRRNIFTLLFKDKLPPYSSMKYDKPIKSPTVPSFPSSVDALCQLIRVHTLNNPCPKSCKTPSDY